MSVCTTDEYVSHMSSDLNSSWYAILDSSSVPKWLKSHSPRPHSFRLFGEPLILYRDETDNLVCLEDRCPHKSARLSRGLLLENGSVECPYHGWQIKHSADTKIDDQDRLLKVNIWGKINNIPTVSAYQELPSVRVKAKVAVDNDGFSWVWKGDPENADMSKIPKFENLYPQGTRKTEWVEVPIDHSLLIENLMDPAHVPFVHNGSISNKSLARTIEMKLFTFENGFGGKTDLGPDRGEFSFRFHPPTSIELTAGKGTKMPIYVRFHFLPIAPNRTRVLFRTSMPLSFNWDWLPIGYFRDYLKFWVLSEDVSCLMTIQWNVLEGAPTLQTPLMPQDIATVAYRIYHQKCFGVRGGPIPISKFKKEKIISCSSIQLADETSSSIWWRGYDDCLDIEDLIKCCDQTEGFLDSCVTERDKGGSLGSLQKTLACSDTPAKLTHLAQSQWKSSTVANRYLHQKLFMTLRNTNRNIFLKFGVSLAAGLTAFGFLIRRNYFSGVKK